nr:type II toxin-antitoxin system RelE/ParE family toxin [Desulfobulbus elongatus]
MFEIKHYITDDGRDVFEDWRDKVKDSKAKIAIDRRIYRAELGNFGDHKPCREGVWELRIDVGPGKPWSCCFAAASSVRRTPTYRRRANTGRTGSAAT